MDIKISCERWLNDLTLNILENEEWNKIWFEQKWRCYNANYVKEKKERNLKECKSPWVQTLQKNVIGVSYDEASVIGVYGLTFINTNKKVI